MISTDLQRVQIQDIVEYQLPAFVRDDFPLVGEFLKQYYISQEYPTSPSDVIQNIDEYIKLETLIDSQEETLLSEDISFSDEEIITGYNLNSEQYGTYHFPERYGLIKIDNEIILYTFKDKNTFYGCIRGFSGITSFNENDDRLTFSSSEADSHLKGSKIVNLSNFLLKEFLIKLKKQIAPGFENRSINSNVNQKLFLPRTKDFYQSKGTDESFRILFAALYGEKAEVVKPKEFLFRPSDAQYRITRDIVVESVVGDPLKLKNQTLYQDAYPEYGIERAYATIVDCEKIVRGDKAYYQLSVDFDYTKNIELSGGTVYGSFVAHPKTQNTVTVSSGSSVIDVDSTIGFPDKGNLYVKGQSGILTYRSKNINQFIGVGLANTTSFGTNFDLDLGSELNLNVSAYGFEGFSATSGASRNISEVGTASASKIEVRIGKVLGDNFIHDETSYFSENDKIKIKSLGINASKPRNNSWITNVSPRYDVKSVSLIDISNFSYSIETFANHNLRIGDSVTIIQSDSSEKTGVVVDVTSKNIFTFGRSGELKGKTFDLRKNILKPKVSVLNSDYSYVENTFANVQNTYAKYTGDVLVASSSIPSYHDTALNFYDKKVSLNGEYNGELFTIDRKHGFFTGDKVYYKPFYEENTVEINNQTVILSSNESKFENINPGVYYVRRIDDKQFKLSSSVTNLYNNDYISVSGIVTNNYLYANNYQDKILQHQKLLREFKPPVDDGKEYVTLPGKTGMLVNGVEILNYKSGDSVYYGQINNITVSSPGEGYDIINPPVLSIQDSTGIGATGIVNVKGSLQKINIIDPGFDYVTNPIITITGGNGSGADAYANTKLITHSVSFTSSNNIQVGLSSNTIGFSTFHKFKESEKVIYKTGGQTPIGGITDNSEYYVKLIDSKTVKLFANESDVVNGTNPINLTSDGNGIHRFESFEQKRILSDIIISSPGVDYENKTRVSGTTGINTALNQINISRHGFKSGEIIVYSGNASGLSNDQNYIVTTIDTDNFKLSSIGVGTEKLFYYNTKQYINIESVGSDSHVFNYPPISVDITGQIGTKTFEGQDFNAKLQPVFRGSVESIQLTDNGVGYGSSEILNFNKQPSFSLLSGKDARLIPIVNDGKIDQVLFSNNGDEYNSPPDLIVNGVGKFAKVTPVLNDGKIVDIVVNNPGIGYDNRTTISIIPSGSGANLIAEINQWNLNLFEKYQDIIGEDDGILDESLNDEYGLQYTHLYAPRKLRESIFSRFISDIDGDEGIKYGLPDLRIDDTNSEIASEFHSPIIGWAYDGNPIYGPYGYDNPSGGIIRALKSGYKLRNLENRPPLSIWKQGFFCEDYIFTEEGDLDKHNGRYCVTPDFPEGVYAYFATINDGFSESSGTFENYKLPQYPYLIGDTFKSKPNEYNYKNDSYQDKNDISDSNWLRNTTPYGLTEKNVAYDFATQPYNIHNEVIDINKTSVGSIDNIDIIFEGDNYKVDDRILFESVEGASDAKARVSHVSGKVISNISATSNIIQNVEITPLDSSGRFVAFSNSPHELTNNNLVSLSGFSTSINLSNKSFNIGISSVFYNLETEVGTTDVTGIVTYFSVSGGIVDRGKLSVRENDILKIGSEKVRVLNVDKINSRLRVERAIDGTVSTAHIASSSISEQSRKFTFNSNREDKVKFELNKQIYFDPQESLSIGILTGTGVGSTIFFSNPGANRSSVFVENRNIFLPDHNLKTGEIVIYNNGEGQSIEVVSNGSTYEIENDTPLYIVKTGKDTIGIQTFKVGIGSLGTIVGVADTTKNYGLLAFSGIGTGTKHSFKTTRNDAVTAEVTKNTITASTDSSHGLLIGDHIKMSVTPGITTAVIVKYNDHNRRIVFNPISFEASDINTEKNTIRIENHNLNTGDKIILESNPAPNGVEDQKIYFVFKYSRDEIKLCETKYQTKKFDPKFVSINTKEKGSILSINPPLSVYSGNTVEFNLGDSSLSSLNSSTRYSAFDMNLYKDSNFSNEFIGSFKNNSFQVLKEGKVGIDSTANLKLIVNDETPKNLYYNFTPVNLEFINLLKKEIIIDKDIIGNNKINVNSSKYSGDFVLTSAGGTIFGYDIKEIPERDSYNKNIANIKYSTNSKNAHGGIADINITNKGSNYSEIVGVSTIISESNGKGAILEPSSSSIGKIISTNIKNIGFDYPTDNTIRPTSNLPEVILLEPLNSFERIGITSSGLDYNIAPNLVVLDGLTGEHVQDVDLFFRLGDSEVTVRKNSKGISNAIPTILPIRNTNGISINNASFDISTKDVTIGLGTAFNTGDEDPFAVGDKVMIENISVGIGSTGSGFNSVDYNYQLFTLTGVNIPRGGNTGVVTFSLSGIIGDNLHAGNFDALNSSGRIIKESTFPQFDIKLKKNNFLEGEKIISDIGEGNVDSWNNKVELFKVSTSKDFKVGDILVGQSSGTQGIVKSKIEFNSEIETKPSAIVKKGWNTSTGFFNDNQQRIPDNFYYQNFSYAIKSRIPLQEWNDTVSSLNHTAGFLKFSDLVIESSDNSSTGVFTDESSDVTLVIDLLPENVYGGDELRRGSGGGISVHCYPVFDLVTENSKVASGTVYSDRVFLESRVLEDYYESVGNRVLMIDDISTQFNSEERPTKFNIVKRFPIEQKSKKILTFVRDKIYYYERQASITTLVHDGSQAEVLNYGRVESVTDLGSFDFNIFENEGQLLFYPTKYRFNSYYVSYCSLDIDSSLTGVGSTDALGSICDIRSTQVEIPESTKTTIVGIASTYRSSKVLVEFNTNTGVYGFNELNVIHDGTEVELLEYGDLSTNFGTNTAGLGTYSVDMSAGTINIDFNPNPGIALTANTLRVSLSSIDSVGIGTTVIGTSKENVSELQSFYTQINSSASPSSHKVAEYSHEGVNDHSAAYYLVSIEDTTNNEYQLSELIVLDDDSDAFITEYGTLNTGNSGIGTFGSSINSATTELLYTPPENADVQLRIFQQALQLVVVDATLDSEIDMNNASITSGFGFYEGTAVDVKREFEMTYKGVPIFQRNIDGSDPEVVNTFRDTITIPDHFFVTGEKLKYSVGISTHERIGIAQTTFAGIGETTLLPDTDFVYAIKLDESRIKLASSAQNANASTPIPINFTNVGVGTFHTLTSTKQNTKCLVTLDNFIQTPIVSTAVTTSIDKEVSFGAVVIETTGITSFFASDLIQVESEIMKVNTVGFGTTNGILVTRGWMGTGISTHPVGVAVTKVDGAYNIVNNRINFYTAPQGPTPFSSTTNPPDERDFTGITTFSKFQGRVFLRTEPVSSEREAYNNNYIFDSISDQFDASTKTFTLKAQNNDVAGISTNNGIVLINDVLQGPTGQLLNHQDYFLSEGSGISSITFTGTATSVAYDPNNASVPVGGYIVSVGSTSGLGYQPLISAGGTAVVSNSGTIANISIGNSGSGYRSNIQTVNVGVYTSSTGMNEIEFIGTGIVDNGHIIDVNITNSGSGYEIGSEPTVVFDAPLSYSDIPLVYSQNSPTGFGTQATIDIVVGQGSSVIDFEIKNLGYRYGQKQILTVPIGDFGIPTDSNYNFEEFQINIEKVNSDKFSAWHFGELQRLDNIDNEFDGKKRKFAIKSDGEEISIRSRIGSNIDVESLLLVFVNDILQVPGVAYEFTGGSTINFSEPPKGKSEDGSFKGDTCKILFYKGSGDIDVVLQNVLPSLKRGDELSIRGDDSLVPFSLDQESRVISEILTTEALETFPYYERGIDPNPDHARTVTWCQQTNDKVIDGKIVSKARQINSALINPKTNLIQSVGIGSTQLYVESVVPFFNPGNEEQKFKKRHTVSILSQDEKVSAAATAIVSDTNTIESISISHGGSGYNSVPSVIISNPVGLGISARASAVANITDGTVTSITVTNPGIGYTRTSVPQILIEEPSISKETNKSNFYYGDFGEIIGVKTTSVSVASTGFVFDFFIPVDSYLRNPLITSVGLAVTISNISVGDYFTVRNSTIGSGVTSLYQTGERLGVTTEFVDCVYEVAAVSVVQKPVVGVGITYVKEVTVSVEDHGDISGIENTISYGEFSWGRISLGDRINATEFDAQLLNGASGIQTGTIVSRVEPLKLVGYSTTPVGFPTT